MTQMVVRVQDGKVTVFTPAEIDALSTIVDDAECFSIAPHWLRPDDGTRIVVARGEVERVTN